MSPDLDPQRSRQSKAHRLRCCYVNNTSKFQILRVVDMPDCFFERAVCPDQRIVFEAFADAHLQVHTDSCVSAVLADTIPCYRLALDHVDRQSDQPACSSVSA